MRRFIRHGDLHPVAWCQYYDGGRAWLTTLGHDAAAFTEGSEFPGQREFEQLVVNGIKSAMGLIPFCTGESAAIALSAGSASVSAISVRSRGRAAPVARLVGVTTQGPSH